MGEPRTAGLSTLFDILQGAFIVAINRTTIYDPAQTLGAMAPAPYTDEISIDNLFADVNGVLSTAPPPQHTHRRIERESIPSQFRITCIGQTVAAVTQALLDAQYFK